MECFQSSFSVIKTYNYQWLLKRHEYKLDLLTISQTKKKQTNLTNLHGSIIIIAVFFRIIFPFVNSSFDFRSTTSNTIPTSQSSDNMMVTRNIRAQPSAITRPQIPDTLSPTSSWNEGCY